MISILGFLAPFMVYSFVLGAHLLLPARQVTGYVRGAHGKLLDYRLNGVVVLVISVSVWALLGWSGLVAYDWLYRVRYESLAGACTLGLAFTLAIVLPQKPVKASLLADLYLGRLENPQALGGRLDWKMFLYLVGAVMLELNLLSALAHHLMLTGAAYSLGVVLHVALFSWFLLDYLFFERVHLYTYDFFAERVGFKLGWGCLTFYPYFYAIGLFSTADLRSPGSPTWLLVASAVVFFAGWSLARGANMQKFFFKLDPGRKFLGRIAPVVLRDEKHVLLCNGFWGLSRHINYLGEVLMATGLVLSLGYLAVPWPWLYPLYYVALLVPRERADHRRCAEKYGALWQRYCEKVPWRIVPGVY